MKPILETRVNATKHSFELEKNMQQSQRPTGGMI